MDVKVVQKLIKTPEFGSIRAKKTERDSFEITVWNGLGGYDTQCIHVKCDK